MRPHLHLRAKPLPPGLKLHPHIAGQGVNFSRRGRGTEAQTGEMAGSGSSDK